MRFGGLIAVDDLSFTAYRREITAIIGPNGAGKTTVFNCLTGFYPPSSGRLALHGASGMAAMSFCSNGWTGFRIAQRPAWRAPSRTSACSPACRCWKT